MYKMSIQDKIVTIVTVAFSIATAFLLFTTHTAQANASTIGKYRTINGIYNTDGTIDTADGHCWKIRKSSFAYQNGTPVAVKFNTHGTKSKLDDSIVRVTAKDKNRQLVNNYIRHNYDLNAFKVKYISTGKLTAKMIRERATRHIIYVEIIKSVSSGGKSGTYGKGYYIAYNKRVSKGKHVTNYCVWNPDNAYCDDIVAVADNGKIR